MANTEISQYEFEKSMDKTEIQQTDQSKQEPIE
jgi:hypothetical protein